MKVTQSLLVALGALAVADARRFGNGGSGKQFGGGSGAAGNSTGASTTAAGASTTVAAAATTTAAAGSSASSSTSGTGSTGNDNAGSGGANSLTLLAANVQSGSDSTGSANAEAGQSDSATDPANFINFCTGQTLTNGLQVKTGSCNGVVMGNIPSTDNMISSIITFPGPGDTIAANQNFTISVQTKGLTAGTFTNPDTTYYSAPQDLDGSGQIIGHTHVTVQDLGGDLATTTPPTPGTFTFFKGINDAGDNGLLSAAVAGGLPAGSYRVCTMTSSANHQPVLMPVAQRGAQDDCQKFTVTDSGAAGNDQTNTGAGSSAASSVAGSGSGSVATSAVAASSTAAAVGSTSTGTSGSTTGQGNSGKFSGQRGSRNGGGRRGRFMTREFIE